MLTREEIIQFCLKFSGTRRDRPFHDPNWDAVRTVKNGKIFALVFFKDGHIWVNVKMDPEWKDFWRDAFSSILPAYHMNKEHWSSIILDGTIPDSDICKIISGSYELVSGKQKGGKLSEFAKNVYWEVKKIPVGKVATYGQIARLAGRPGAARAVGTLMRNCPQEMGCPCHRVISGNGKLAPEGTFGEEGEQERRLAAEGISVKNHKVDLGKWQMQF